MSDLTFLRLSMLALWAPIAAEYCGGMVIVLILGFTLGWMFRGAAVRSKVMSRRTVCQKHV